MNKPMPLPDPLPKAPSLTPELASQMLPETLRAWILDEAERLQSPIESIAVCVFGAASSVVGRKIGIHPKQEDDWLVTPNLWTALVAPPGQKKSSIIDAAYRPLEALEDEARTEFGSKNSLSDVELKVKKIEIENVEDQIKKGLKAGHSIEVHKEKLADLHGKLNGLAPIERRFRTSDATVEKIGELLRENPNGLIIKRDELTGWLAGLNRPGHEGDREFFLESWNGNGRFRVDRIKRGAVDIEAICLTIMGGIQPGKLEAYVKETCRGGKGDDGLLQRFQLLVYPDRPTQAPTWIDRKPNFQARERAIRVFRAINFLNPEFYKDPKKIMSVRFDAKAQILANEWFQSLESVLFQGKDLSPALESHLAKYRKLMPALALLFHLLETAESMESIGPLETSVSIVSEAAVVMASFWCDFLEGHAKKVYAISTHSEYFGAEALAKKIQSGAVTDGMKIRDIRRRQWSMLTDSNSIYAAISVLEQCHWVRVETLKTEGAPTRVLKINPSVSIVSGGTSGSENFREVQNGISFCQ